MINLKALNSSTRFVYTPEVVASEGVEAQPAEWIGVRVCSGQTLRDIEKACSGPETKTFQVVDGNPVVFVEKEVNKEKQNEMIWDYCITDWYLRDEEGNEIPCNLEMKKRLMLDSVEFATFFANALTEVRKAKDKKAEAARKNS